MERNEVQFIEQCWPFVFQSSRNIAFEIRAKGSGSPSETKREFK